MSENIEHTYEDVENLFSQYIHEPNDKDLIKRAYEFACEKHSGQFRKSGQPYVIHVIEVAYLVTKLQCGPITIASAFLHDTIEDCGVTQEELEQKFNKDVADIVFALTKIKAISHTNRLNPEFVAEGHMKIFLGMAKDIRVILIKLCDRLHNMRTLDFQTPEKKISISRETLEVYAPIADRLGLNEIKGELQDLCLKYLEPKAYNEIVDYLDKNIKYKQDSINKLMKKIADLLIPSKIPFTILARVKRPFSIYTKFKNKNLTWDTIYDIVALRIITETELNCYEILGIIHSVYTPISGRFKDYIAVPKPNMYQSLHTTIIDNDSTTMEIQIRTKKMDEIAESGVAAHWRYKEGSKYDAKAEQKEITEKLHWFSDFVNMSQTYDKEDSKEYMANLTNDIFGANIYCFTPNGKVIDLPTGATPLDFAYKIHTKVGESASGAVVNNQLVPLSHKLETGDIVEIKTANKPMVNEGWLKIVTTQSAKNHIKKYLVKQNEEFLKNTNIQKGKDTLLDVLKEYDCNEKKFLSLANDELLKHYNVNSLDDLYLQIESKNVLPSDVTSYLGLKNDVSIESIIQKNAKNRKVELSSQAVLVKGVSNVLCTLSSCCSPLPGEDIVGYVSHGKGVKVHRRDCPNVQDNKRLIEVEWNPNAVINNVSVSIAIKATDRQTLLVDIMNVLAQMKIICTKVSAKQHPENLTSTINVTIQVSGVEQYRNVVSSLRSVQSVYDVERVTF